MATVSLPVLPHSPSCSVDALLTMSNALPASCDSPLFQVFRAGALFTLTDSRARKHLKDISAVMGLQKPLTFQAGWGFLGSHCRIFRPKMAAGGKV